ncbi:MAG TPA: acyltransferase family protein [Solirubrobacteraceae bacterium]|nr:acyltransferase family protein [Solirubrobacteraceae bacterium]
MRALAVLLVALNHANVPFLPGGYIGVDVFFVLSGYFITGLLLREGLGGAHGREGEQASGHISISRFYARRARRILPAATLTLAVTAIAVYVVYDLMQKDFLGTKPALLDELAAALFYANVHFAAGATNYFANAAMTMPSPVVHFWSLSVEEQFYLVWPSLLAATLWVCRRRGAFDRRRAARLVGLVIAAVCLGSLAWSIHDTSINPQSAYFSTFARAWELGLGAGMALLAPAAAKLPAAIRGPLGWVGLGMVLFAAVDFSSHTSFPGYAALLPVGGSALMVLGGLHATRAGVDRLLALRPLAYIGDRSYTFYLWHYPTLIISWQLAGHALPVGENIALLAGAFALSALTFQFYENPLRFARWLRGWRTAAMIPVSIGTSVAAIMVPVFTVEATLTAEAQAAQNVSLPPLRPAAGQPDPISLLDAKPIPALADAVKAVHANAPLPKVLVPDGSTLAQENTAITYDTPHGCQPSFGSGVTSRICRLGDPGASRVVAVFGDSHAGMWVPALLPIAEAQHFAVVVLDKPGCFVNRIHTNLSGWPCGDWYRWALQQDHKLDPVATLVDFKLSGSALEDNAATTVSYLRSVLRQVRNGVWLEDDPGQQQKTATCITAAGATQRSCSSPVTSSYTSLVHDIQAMLMQTKHLWLPTLQWFCADGICPSVINHTLTTHDGDHLTTEYSTDLAPLLAPEMRRVLARLG